jgi:molybdopterin converting factor subunit 1
MTRSITVQYFALLREQAACSEEQVASAAPTAGALYAELKARHGFTLPERSLKVAVNDEFAPWDQPLNDRDRVVFIPPVAGG